MLKISRLPRRNVQSFVCWKCLASLHSGSTFGRRRPLQGSDRNGQLSSKQIVLRRDTKSFSTSYAVKAETEPQDGQLPQPSDIRDRLRAWEAQNASSYAPITITDYPKPGALGNMGAQAHDTKFTIEEAEDMADDDISDSGFNDLVDVGSRRGFLIPGDLVEVIGQGRKQELGIYLRDVGRLAEFYTMSGSLIKGSLKSTQFYVPGFFEKDELDIIQPYLPSPEAEQLETSNTHQIKEQIPREVTKPLIDKMLKFWNESEEFHQRASSRLDDAHSLVAEERSFRYVTLNELANVVLETAIPRNEDGTYPYPALYALHRSIIRNEIGFRPQKKGATRTGGQYEVSSKVEVGNIMYTVEAVRRYQTASVMNSKLLDLSIIRWIKDCQGVIDKSRKSRKLTPHGTIIPTKTSGYINGFREKAAPSPFTDFIKSWAAFRTIHSHSFINSTGSALLRAIDRYEDLPLDQSTAWTLLQEIGEIHPTENRVAYDLRIHNHGPNKIFKGDFFTSEDSMSDLRKDFHLPVYCIDAAGAHEVDDGVSIERTETPNEYWVHIHAADPASRLEAKGNSADRISNRTETVYAPEEVHFLLPSDFVQDNLSLDVNRPSLTFSAKMNLKGDILDIKISPYTILDVKYITPDVVEEVITGKNPQNSASTTTTITVGLPITPEPEKRAMLQSHQLSQEHKEDLQILYKIGDARLKQRIAQGGISMNIARIELAVSPMATSIQLQKKKSSSLKSKVDAVAPLMLIAAEVAARWCHERGIPIPYRITPRSVGKNDPLEFYKEVVLPSLDQYGNPPVSIALDYFRLLGPVLPSTTPGPHIAVGVQMMAKCTSPLRRYGDLLLHWQVQAALREESRLGHDLFGNTKEDFLPFSKAELDRIISHLDARERMIKEGNRESTRHWLCHFLVRAWRFKEAYLPPTFRFTVSQASSFGTVWGKLDFFDAAADLVKSENFDIVDVKEGEVLEVELVDVNVYSRSITVEAIRRLT